MCNNTKAISFWDFLKENTLEIPIIQRDYAQGRLCKENLRKNFLADLKNALDSGGTMKLDFVYGSIENGNLNPLDGQQRLTTLWLLHWYIALRAGELSEDNCKIFRKFTYETRISSREFCQNLCHSKHFENFDGNDIIGFITNQTWFYSAWKLDPTIQSMLRMLGGTKVTNKKNEDIVDGIEELFKCSSECFIDGKVYCVFKCYWEKLTSDNAPVVFYHLPLKDFGLSDDLYIKMNARGKQLTSFENFKADLIGYITKQAEDNHESGWKGLLDAKNGIPIKLDTDWTDIFWKNKSKESKIDEIYFAFINRYFLQELICAKKEDKTDLYSADNLEKNNGAFRHLYGEQGEDSRLQYFGLDKYMFNDDKTIPLSFFTSLSNTLNKLKLDLSGCKFFDVCCINNYFPIWVDSEFEYIPKYNEISKITTLGQKERVVFLAISRYLEMGGFNNVSFKRWMRVVWNIVENSGIETISAMIGAMRLIDELSEGAHNIYNFLSNSQLQIKSNFAKDQIAEEIAKAKQILDENENPRKYKGPCKKEDGSDYQTWEEIIIEAEKYAFFKGAIRFLFTDGEGKINWCDFDTKWDTAQKYFDDAGIKQDYKIEITKKLVIQCVDWEKQLYDKQVFNPSSSTWKWILCSENWREPINNILTNELTQIQPVTTNKDSNIEKYLTPLFNKLPFEWMIKHIPNGRFRWLGPRLAYYKPYGREYILFDWGDFKRNEILSSIGDINTNHKINNGSFYWGWDIQFTYKGRLFQWQGNNDVRLIEDIEKCEPVVKDDSKDNPEEKWFCFSTTSEMASDITKFTAKLDQLINDFQNTIQK